MKINVISESEFFPKGHGVHTAYLNHVAMLKKLNIEVITNSLKKADVVHIETIGPFGLYKLLSSPKTVVSAHIIPASFEGSLAGTRYWLGSAKKYLRFFYNKANLVLAVALAKRLKLPFDSSVKIKLYGIGEQALYASPGEVVLKIGDRETKARSFFVYSRDSALLLGRLDVFEQFSITFDKEKQSVIFRE